MSYILSRIRCDHCKLEMNAAFCVVGTSIIAEWPKTCPTCGLGQFTKIADGWQYNPVSSPPPEPGERTVTKKQTTTKI